MNTARNLFVLTALAASVWAQPDLFFNKGALVYVQPNALVYVQGGYVNNDQGTFQCTTQNYGTIWLVNGTSTFRGSLTNGQDAEFNTYPGSLVRLQGDFTNEGYYRAGTGNYGGIIEFNGTDIQNYQNTGNAQEWTLDSVRINNTATDILQRHVLITNNTATNKDMFIRKSLTFLSGRIHTGSYEVRMINSDQGAITRAGGTPPSTASWKNLVSPDNADQYIYGQLRWNVAADQTYSFIVGGDPDANSTSGRGIQQIDVKITADGGGHYVRVRFSSTKLNDITQSAYCRAPDGANRLYKTLDNGHWIVEPFNSLTAPAPDPTYTDLAGVTMHNRVVSTPDSSPCPAAGTPGDPHFTNTPSNKCFVGINYDTLQPPNNCEGSNTGFTVSRTGFGSYKVNNTYQYVTVYTGLSPLPSDELRLSAAPAGQAIRLTWNITLPEAEYILGYELYRKTENGTFTRIAQIDKQGRMQYTHDDAYVAPNTRYFYQVGQHDVFGNVRYSNIVEAILPSRGDGFSAQLQPNPITSEGSLLVNIPAEGTLAFTLYDAAGKMVAQHSWTLAAGAHQLDLAPILAQIAAGNYNAHVTFGGEVKTLRLIKLDHTR
jgi:hypothetical protein